MYRTDKEDYGLTRLTNNGYSEQDQKELNWQMVTEVN